MRSRERFHRPAVLAFALLATASSVLSALELKPRTLAAFDRYIQLTEARMNGEVAGSAPFLWIDRQPEKDRQKLLAGLSRGEIPVAHLETLDGRNDIDVPDGMLHHWVGTILLPGVKLPEAIAYLQQYDQYPTRFAPTVQRARVLKHAGDHFEVGIRTWSKKLMVTVVLDADYVIDYRHVSATRVWTKSVATNVREIQSPGESGEKAIPGDSASGYLWRLNNYCSFEERSDGVVQQCESISLTRRPPFGTGLIIKPFISGIPRETLEFTLGHTRAGLQR